MLVDVGDPRASKPHGVGQTAFIATTLVGLQYPLMR